MTVLRKYNATNLVKNPFFSSDMITSTHISKDKKYSFLVWQIVPISPCILKVLMTSHTTSTLAMSHEYWSSSQKKFNLFWHDNNHSCLKKQKVLISGMTKNTHLSVHIKSTHDQYDNNYSQKESWVPVIMLARNQTNKYSFLWVLFVITESIQVTLFF